MKCLGIEKMNETVQVPVKKPEMSARDREFLPAAMEILETPPAPMPVALMLTLCGFIALALIWSFIGRLDIHAVALGKIETSSRSKVIQPLDSGKVARINVENGSKVKAGQVLVEFDAAEAAADEKAASEGLEANRAEMVRRLVAIDVARGIPDNVTTGMPDVSLNLSPDVGWRASISSSLKNRETAVLSADLSHLGESLQNIGKQMAQKEATRERLHLSIGFQNKLIKTLYERVGVREESIKLSVGTKINLFDAREALEKSQSALASDRGQLLEAQAALEELSSQKRKTISQFIADNQGKLSEAARKGDEAEQQVNKARAKLGRTSLTAPIDGTVQQLALTTQGQVVTTGQQLMVLIPDGDKLQVEIFVSNLDIGFVKLGQEAAIKVDAFPFTRFGTLNGKVIKIAKDAIDEQDARRSQANSTALTNAGGAGGGAGQPQNFVFPVTLELLETAMKIDNVVIPLTPGMTVAAEIKTDSRSVISYLMSPIAKVTSEAMRER
jgi:hemolysin D